MIVLYPVEEKGLVFIFLSIKTLEEPLTVFYHLNTKASADFECRTIT